MLLKVREKKRDDSRWREEVAGVAEVHIGWSLLALMIR